MIEHLEQRQLLSTGAIAGIVFNDANADGIHQASEAGLSGWKVFADLNRNGTHEASEPASTSGTGGAWTIGNLSPGSYVIREIRQNYWTKTSPKAGSYTVKLTSGHTSGGFAFGDVRKTASTLVDFNFDAGTFSAGHATFAPAQDLIGRSTIAQTGNDLVIGGQAGNPGLSAAWNRGVNDGGNALALHIDPLSVKSLSLSFEYRSTAVSPSGISYGPSSISFTAQIDGSNALVTLPAVQLTRDSGWHLVTINLASIAGLTSAKGVTIQLLPGDGKDLGTLSIDNLAVRGIQP
jgi:hypothetical protein